MNPIHNHRNKAVGYGKLPCDVTLLGPLSFESSDGRHITIGKNTLASGFYAPLNSMRVITEGGSPLKVGPDIVALIGVEVIDLGKAVWIRNEGESHHPVDDAASFVRGCAQQDVEIPPRPQGQIENSSLALLLAAPSISDQAVKASNPSETADFVEGTELGESDWSPFFGLRGIHEAGRLSGCGGLVVKNPSRGGTLGGFAVDSTAPYLTQDR